MTTQILQVSKKKKKYCLKIFMHSWILRFFNNALRPSRNLNKFTIELILKMFFEVTKLSMLVFPSTVNKRIYNNSKFLNLMFAFSRCCTTASEAVYDNERMINIQEKQNRLLDQGSQ